MLNDDEIYLACLLAIGPWNFTVEQVQFLMDQFNKKLGRKAEIQEAMDFINGYRRYSRRTPEKHEAVASIVTGTLTKEAINENLHRWLTEEVVEQSIDTHTVGL